MDDNSSNAAAVEASNRELDQVYYERHAHREEEASLKAALKSWKAPAPPQLSQHAKNDVVARTCHEQLTKLALDHTRSLEHINAMKLRCLDIPNEIEAVKKRLPNYPPKFAHIGPGKIAKLQEELSATIYEMESAQKRLHVSSRCHRVKALALEMPLRAACQELCSSFLAAGLPLEVRDSVYEQFITPPAFNIAEVNNSASNFPLAPPPKRSFYHKSGGEEGKVKHGRHVHASHVWDKAFVPAEFLAELTATWFRITEITSTVKHDLPKFFRCNIPWMPESVVKDHLTSLTLVLSQGQFMAVNGDNYQDGYSEAFNVEHFSTPAAKLERRRQKMINVFERMAYLPKQTNVTVLIMTARLLWRTNQPEIKALVNEMASRVVPQLLQLQALGYSVAVFVDNQQLVKKLETECSKDMLLSWMRRVQERLLIEPSRSRITKWTSEQEGRMRFKMLERLV